MKLTGPVLRTLLDLFPDGCDVVEGREADHVHAQPLEPRKSPVTGEQVDRSVESAGCLVGGVLNDDPTRAGAIGIFRDTYFELPGTRT